MSGSVSNSTPRSARSFASPAADEGPSAHPSGRALGAFLGVVVSLLLLWLVLEAGLRVVRVPGFAPIVGINEPHPSLGWTKRTHATTRKKTGEFDVEFAINSVGLRDDADLPQTKPPGERRVLCVGDSFVLGYTVDRDDLFVDLLERSLDSQSAPVQVLNGGTEGYATDQELVWLREIGMDFQPDLIVWCFYQNDVYWAGQPQYAGTPKPRFSAQGNAESAAEPSGSWPPEPSWFARNSCIGGFFHTIANAPRDLLIEFAAGKHMPKEEAVVPSFPAGQLEARRLLGTGGCLSAGRRGDRDGRRGAGAVHGDPRS